MPPQRRIKKPNTAFTTHPLEVTREEVLAAKTGNKKAVGHVVEKMTPLCLHLCKRYMRFTHLPQEELLQEARIAVAHAITKYDTKYTVPFRIYSVRWMQAYLLRMVVKANPLDSRNRTYKTLSGAAASFISMSIPEGEEGHLQLADTVDHPDEAIHSEERLKILKTLIGKLAVDRQYIITERLKGRTLDSIGIELGYSRERIRQIERDIKARLKRSLGFYLTPLETHL